MKKFLTVFMALFITSFISAAYADGEITVYHCHCICGANDCKDAEHTKSVNWQAWNGDTTVGTASDTSVTEVYLYLENNVTITDTLNITNVTVYLCLNGKTLTVNKEGSPAIRVGENQTFVLCDCMGTGKITGARGSANNDTYRFGAINCQSGSSFIMYGGCISDNTVENSNGGGIFVKGGTFTMHGGSIRNNKAPNGSGGAISVENGKISTFGGEMTENSAINGGAIHINGSTKANIQNLKANANIANNMGGAIFTETSGIVEIRDIELWKNKASFGGGIYIKFAADNIYAKIYNADIQNNSATGNGGGIYFNGNGKSNPSTDIYDSNICNNSSASDGGGIFAARGAMLNLRGGSVSNNTCAAGGGGGIRAASDTYIAVINYENPLYIKGNTADLGGGVSASGDAFVVYGNCEIEENTARKSGGGVYIDYIYSWCIFSHTTITKNIAPLGGGICLNKKNDYGRELEIMEYTTIIGNTSSDDGSPSNLYLNNGKKFQFRKGMTGNEKIGVSVSTAPTVDAPAGIVYTGSESWSDGSDHTNLIESDNDNYMVIYNSSSQTHQLVPCYTVTVDPNNGDEVQHIKVKCGDALSSDRLTVPEFDGYEFDGWYADGLRYNFDEPVNGNITITAEWNKLNRTSMEVYPNNIVVYSLDRPAVLFVASYNGSSLLDIKTLELNKSEKTFITINEADANDGIHINTKNATKMSAYLWDTATGGINMLPLCESMSAELSKEAE